MSQGHSPGAILLIHWTSPPTTGGVESHLAELAGGLADRQRRVIVLTGEQAPLADARYRIVITPLLDLARIKAGLATPSHDDAAWDDLLAALIAAHGITNVHGHNLHHFDPVPALAVERARLRFGVRVFHTFHETWPDLLADTPVYRGWDGNFAVSSHVREQCRDRIGFAPDLFPLGVDTRRFSAGPPCFAAGGPAIILHPARLLPWKGTDVSVRALHLLVARGFTVELVITDTQRIADWDDELDRYRAQVMALIDQLDLQSSVRFVAARYDDMPGLYRNADIVVYPTIGEEPYGLVPIEAMSCERPIVASRSGGMLETVIDGVTGFLVDRGDADMLADRIAALIRDPSSARRMGVDGRLRVRAHFGADAYLSRLLASYDGKARAGWDEPSPPDPPSITGLRLYK